MTPLKPTIVSLSMKPQEQPSPWAGVAKLATGLDRTGCFAGYEEESPLASFPPDTLLVVTAITSLACVGGGRRKRVLEMGNFIVYWDKHFVLFAYSQHLSVRERSKEEHSFSV